MNARNRNRSVACSPGASIPSTNPIELSDWLEPVMNEFADEIAMLSDRISDHLIDDIEQSFAHTDLWREIAFLALASRIVGRVSEALDELMRLRMLDHARQFPIGPSAARPLKSE